VRDLVAAQFPHWKILDVVPAPHQGNDNRTFRLGDELSVRLPSAEAYAAGVMKEDRVLPLLSGKVSVALPDIVATGQPSDQFPLPWSVRRWLPGETLERASWVDREQVAEQLGGFLVDLRRAPAAGGTACGRHSFFRGCHPSVYSDEVQQALDLLGETIDRKASEKIWAEAVRSAWSHDPVWFHGDLAGGNILVQDQTVSAVIDFGTCGVGDPACDLVIAWTFMDQERECFRRATQLDDDTWPVIQSGGGGGGDGRWCQQMWVCGRCRHPGRSDSCASGEPPGSRSHAQRSTRRRSSRPPTVPK
jgi:aminoglycoside phosphotransferase (APT) family kinase protein